MHLESGFGDPERVGGEDGSGARASGGDYVRERVVPVVVVVLVMLAALVCVTTAAAIAAATTATATTRFVPTRRPPPLRLRVPLPPLSKHVLQIPVRGKIHPPIR